MLQFVQISKNNRQKREKKRTRTEWSKVENNKYTLNAQNEITTEFKVFKEEKKVDICIYGPLMDQLETKFILIFSLYVSKTYNFGMQE